MDVLGVNMKRSKGLTKRSKKAIKVVYISTPMKVSASASDFRAIVQELTGKESDVARFMDTKGVDNSNELLDQYQGAVIDHASMVPLMNSYLDSSRSSDSVSEPFDGLLAPMEGSFMSMFQSNLFL